MEEKLETLKRRVKIAVCFGWEIVKAIPLYPLGKLLYGKRDIWLVSERGVDARDNGYHFFRYLRQEHPEIRSVYIIDRNSADAKKVEALGEVVQYQSIKHYLLFFGAKYRISTHYMGFSPDQTFYGYIQPRLKNRIPGGKTVFLQHGVTKDDMPQLYQQRTKLDMFVCGARPEYDYIAGNWGYKNGEVCYTGFARFDTLHDFTVKPQILIMPTWRNWLVHGADASEETMLQSCFFQAWSSLLKNHKLAQLARKYGVQFLLYPHYEIQKYLDRFTTASQDIVLADSSHYDVQQLLKESMLLITDYSSVYFDFAYMKKPVLYYQFDEEEYRNRHYAQGYFDYRRDGFGEVITQEAELLELLEQYLAGNCSLKPIYQKRMEGFFPLHDTKNCERIYQEILKLPE